MEYSQFTKGSKPETYEYDTSKLIDDGFKHLLIADEKNPEYKDYCDDRKKEGKECRVIELKETNKIHVWVK